MNHHHHDDRNHHRWPVGPLHEEDHEMHGGYDHDYHHHHNKHGHTLYCPKDDCLADYLNDQALAFDFEFDPADHTYDSAPDPPLDCPDS